MIPLPLPVINDTRIRVRQLSSVTNQMLCDVVVRSKGNPIPRLVNLFSNIHAGDRGVELSEAVIPGDELWAAGVRSGAPNRGEMYVQLVMTPPAGGNTFLLLGKGYVYSENPVAIGQFDGSLEGRGDLSPQRGAVNVAGNVDTTVALTLINGMHRIDGFNFMYHCSSDTANRSVIIDLRDVITAAPTGFDAGIDRRVWTISGPTWIANQDGSVFVMGPHYTATADDSVLSVSDHTTAPSPFPIWVDEDNDAELIVTITGGEALDTYSWDIYGESWFA